MKNTFRMALGAATALTVSMAPMTTQAQVFFEDDFNTGGTAGAVARGWEFTLNEFVTETGVDFIIAPEWPEGQDGPGTSTGFINPPQADGTESTGGYLMSDSDAAGGSDDIGSLAEVWAISPVFSTSGASEVWFHANAEIEGNNNGEAIAFLEGTADGGATWIPMWMMVEPQRVQKDFANSAGTAEKIGGWPELGSGSEFKTFSGIHGRWHVPFPPELVNQAEVRVRAGWFETADAWWIALDDIVISTDGPPVGDTVIATEDFENGIPSDWTNTPLNGTDLGSVNGELAQAWDTQALRDPGFPDDPLKLDDQLGPVDVDIVKFAEFFGLELDLSAPDPDINPNGALDGRWLLMLAGRTYAMWQENIIAPADGSNFAANLDTPSYDFSNASSVFIDFLSEVLVGDGSANHNVQVSVDGGSSFTEIFNYHKALMNNGETSYFTHHYLEVPQAAGQSSVIFRFHAEGQDPNSVEGFWVIDDVRVSADTGAAPPQQVTLSLPVFEDFEGLTLGDSVEEEVPASGVWTKSAPAGWSIDDSGVFGAAEGIGVDEWIGWSFTNKDWWAETAGGQGRTEFANAAGTVAVVDPDEWDDLDDPDSQGSYTSFLSTPAISLAGAAADSVVLNFDSSYRTEEPTDVNITVSYDGGAAVEVLRWTWVTTDPNFHPDSTNENVTVALNNPAGASNAVVTFGIIEARNDWWWALDNISISTGTDVSGWELY